MRKHSNKKTIMSGHQVARRRRRGTRRRPRTPGQPAQELPASRSGLAWVVAVPETDASNPAGAPDRRSVQSGAAVSSGRARPPGRPHPEENAGGRSGGADDGGDGPAEMARPRRGRPRRHCWFSGPCPARARPWPGQRRRSRPRSVRASRGWSRCTKRTPRTRRGLATVRPSSQRRLFRRVARSRRVGLCPAAAPVAGHTPPPPGAVTASRGAATRGIVERAPL